MLINLLNNFTSHNSDDDICCVLSTDAYHLPNSKLVQLGLKSIKGAPQTMDVNHLLTDLSSIVSNTCSDVWLPVYDRNIHDPVEHAMCVKPSHKIVILEGLFLLYDDSDKSENGWYKVADHLDTVIFLDTEKTLCRERVVQRKVMCGVPPPNAESHFTNVDSVIYDQLQAGKQKADVLLKMGNGFSVSSVTVRAS